MYTVNRRQIYSSILYLTYFGVCYYFACQWYNKGYLKVFNVFFDTDPSANIASLAHGWGRHAVSHAFLELFSIPSRIFAKIIAFFGAFPNQIILREYIALSICPFFSTLTVYVFNKILIEINIKNTDAQIATLFFAFSFSNLLFAIVTETYAISCFLISCIFLYYYKCKKNEVFASRWIWLILGTLLAGITITNICIFFIIYIAYLIGEEKCNVFESLKLSSLFSFVAVTIVYLFYVASHFLLKYPQGKEGGVKWILTYFSMSPTTVKLNAINFFTSSFNAFFATSPKIIDLKLLNANIINEYNGLSFTVPGDDFLLLLIIAFSIISSIYFFYIQRNDSQWQKTYIICYAIVLFNFCLHMVFGREIFMYTQHWILPISLILTPVIINRPLISILMLAIMLFLNVNLIIRIDSLVSL